MTSQTILTEPTPARQSVSDQPRQSPESRIANTVRTLYKSDHQAEYLDITAQVEVLLNQLQAEA